MTDNPEVLLRSACKVAFRVNSRCEDLNLLKTPFLRRLTKTSKYGETAIARAHRVPLQLFCEPLAIACCSTQVFRHV
jgi:hypothetical protein